MNQPISDKAVRRATLASLGLLKTHTEDCLTTIAVNTANATV